MTDWDRSKEELIQELTELRYKVSELQAKQESSEKPPRPSDGLVSFGTIIRYLGKEELISFYASSTHTVSKLPHGLESDPVSGRVSWFEMWKTFVHPDDLPGIKDAFDGLIEGHSNAFHKRIRVQHGENEYFNDVFFVAVERNENGKATAVIVTSTRRMKGSREQVEAMHRAELLTNVKMVLSEDSRLSNLLGKIRDRMSNLLDSIGKQDWRSIKDRDEDLFLLAHHVATAKKSPEWLRIFIKDRSMKYVWVSKSFSDLLGRLPRDICGRTDQEMYGILTKKEEIKTGEAVMTGAIARVSVTRIVNGKPLPFRDLLSALHWGHGQVAWIWGMARLSDTRMNLEEVIDSCRSPAMLKAMEITKKAAKSDSTVLITGESGSGKDYLAQYIHAQSRRANEPYFSINCAAIVAGLAESELFGHERGAFTGALGQKRGLLELAEGGTLVLNEIGELDLPLQAKLLTFLDTKEFERVGGERKIRVSARIIFATNRNLIEEVKRGKFRGDLFYRINKFLISIPPLRDRSEDIPILVQELLDEIARETGLASVPVVNSRTMKQLISYSWPGNVRELRNVLERWIILSGEDASDFDLPLVGTGLGTQDYEKLAAGLQTESVSDQGPAIVNDITSAVASFHCLPIDLQRHHLKTIAERVCNCQPGTITFMEEVLGMSGESIRTELKRAGFVHEIPKHRPRKAFRNLLMPKIQQYLLEEI